MARLLQLGFAGFVLLHFLAQAYRAYTDRALPEAGVERAPCLVGGLFLLFWLPFTVLGLDKIRRAIAAGSLRQVQGQARALAVGETLGLVITLAFGSVHGALMTWPLVKGTLNEADVRAELVADLSRTWHGLPVQGLAYLCAVGAAAFYAARLTLAYLPHGRPALSRAVVGLAVLAYLLGSYAVIRCGSGSLLP